MQTNRMLLTLTALVAPIAQFPAVPAATIYPIRVAPPSSVYVASISGDGSVAIGSLWNGLSGGGIQFTPSLGIQGSPGGMFVGGVNQDGSVLVGSINTYGGGSRATRFSADTGAQELGTLGGSGYSYAMDVNGDGSVIVGAAQTRFGTTNAFRWTAASGTMENLGVLWPSGQSYSNASAVSEDGQTVVGQSTAGSGYYFAFRWTQNTGMRHLGTLGRRESNATDTNADGSVVVGSVYSPGSTSAFRWTVDGGMQELGHLGGGESVAYGVSGDGQITVGYSKDSFGGLRAVLWSPTLGAQDLNELLPRYGLSLRDWALTEATSVSTDGTSIIGHGYYMNEPVAYLITGIAVPEPSTYAMALAGICCGGFAMRQRKRA